MIRNPLLNTDFYKVSHYQMYPKGTTRIYSNFTPRKSRLEGVDGVVVFGIQYMIIERLINDWYIGFFKNKSAIPEYKKFIDLTLGKDTVTTEHLEKLYDIGYLPLRIKALFEGTICPIGVPMLTITNTVDHAYWLVNYLETIISCTLWQPITSATIAHAYNKLMCRYALETTGSDEFVQWQGHDFSMRGMSSLESAETSGAGHLISFTGTDCIPAISFLERYYGANIEKELIGASVPATEHSVMCMGTKDDEIGTFKRLLDQYPTGILSVVSDTWDLWKVVGQYLPRLKDQILARSGKLVIRPDSGDPVDIICGYDNKPFHSIIVREGQLRLNNYETGITEAITEDQKSGLIEILWNIFGGTVNEKGFKVLDPHIGAIYGDSITLDRAEQICARLKAKGFASTNIVLGIGSYTYQYNTRDTFGFAMKATYGEVNGVGQEIFKDPVTDNGTKKSAKGLLVVALDKPRDLGGKITLYDQQDWQQENYGLLHTVFEDGKLFNTTTISEIRENLKFQQ